jgi:hypothetical protein
MMTVQRSRPQQPPTEPPEIRYLGTWTTQALTGSFGGSITFASAAGAAATYTFTGRGVSWISTTGPDRGKADVYIDGVRKKTIDLYTATAGPRLTVYTVNGLSAGAHTLEIRVLGTQNPSSTTSRVDIDGFALMP